MGLENLQRWHWMLISLVVGALLAYSQLYDLTGKRLTPDESYADRRTIGLAVLVNKLNLAKSEKGYLPIADLTIYPMIDGKICVAGNELQPVQGKPGVGIYKPFQQITDVPFRLIDGPQPPSATYSIQDYVKELQTRNPDLKYRFAWWAVPWVTWTIWISGSFLVIGILMPTFMSVLMGAGYMPPPKPKEAKAVKPTYSGGSEEMEGLVKAKKAGAMTTEEQQQLDALTAKLQQNVGGMTVGGSTAGKHAETATAAAIRNLDAKPLEQTKPIDQPKEDVEWGGEFYPVAHSKHVKDEKP